MAKNIFRENLKFLTTSFLGRFLLAPLFVIIIALIPLNFFELNEDFQFYYSLYLTFWLYICSIIYDAAKSLSVDSKELTEEEAYSILQTLNNDIVGEKKLKFEYYLSHNESCDLDDLFENFFCTKNRLYALTRSLHKYLTSMYEEKAKFRVVLAKMGERYSEEFECYCPPYEIPRSSIESLRKENSGFTRCKITDNVILIPDIKMEGNKKSKRNFFSKCSFLKKKNKSGGIFLNVSQ